MYINRVAGNIEGETYQKLINYLFQTCDTLRVTFWILKGSRHLKKYNERCIKNHEKFQEELSYLILKEKKYKNRSNYGTFYYMRLNAELKKYLLSHSDLLISWENPSDLTFFRNGYCFMESIRYEYCVFLSEDVHDFEILETLGIQFGRDYWEIDKEEQQINKMDY